MGKRNSVPVQVDSHKNLVQSLSGHFSQSTAVYKIIFLVNQHCPNLYLDHSIAHAHPAGCMSDNATQTVLNHNVTVPAFIVLMSATAVNHLQEIN